MARVLLIAPNWDNERNVARRRLHDLRRWLHAGDHECRLITSEGASDRERLVVSDPLGLGGELRGDGHGGKLRRWTRDLRHLPDAGIVWARRVVADPTARAWAADSDLILASSPPESVHLAALGLKAHAPRAKLWVDLQDGWIDDPLRRVIEEFPPRRWLEARLERKVYSHAAAISVVTEAWSRLLLKRQRGLDERVLVLPLAPPQLQLPPSHPLPHDGRLQLLHAGTFTLSHHRRKLELLLEPLLDAARKAPDSRRARLLLLGELHPVEADALATWQLRFAEAGWKLESAAALPRDEYLPMLARQHGLLLLSASQGALPSKLFEYLASGRPILALAPRASAVFEEGGRCEAVHRVDPAEPDATNGILRFLDDAATRETPYAAPALLDEPQLQARFLARVDLVLRTIP